MNINEFEDLMDKCRIRLSDDGNVSFAPFSDKDEERISKIIADHGLEKLSLDDFNGIVAKHRPLYMVWQKLKQQKAEQFSVLTTKQVAELPLEQKLEYMEILFPRNQTINETLEVCQKNEENIKACLFNMDFPKSFWDEERKQADRYASLIAGQPEITDKMKNWQETSLDDKKGVIRQAVNVFGYVYGTTPEIVFFTEEQEKADSDVKKEFSDELEAARKKFILVGVALRKNVPVSEVQWSEYYNDEVTMAEFCSVIDNDGPYFVPKDSGPAKQKFYDIVKQLKQWQ